MRILRFITLVLLCGVVLVAQQQYPQEKREMPLQFRPADELAPHTDDYYLTTEPGARVPDEFFVFSRLNQMESDGLDGYHIPPLLLDVKVLNVNNNVVAGGEVKFTAVVSDPTEVNSFSLGFDGPEGRRTDPGWTSARFIRIGESKSGTQVFEGTLKVNAWARPGMYLPKFAIPANQLGHTKGYFADWHPALRGVFFNVEDHPNVDREAPFVRSLEVTPKQIEIKDTVNIKATVDDDMSGLASIIVTLIGPSNKYVDVRLTKAFMDKTAYVAQFRLNPWYEEGEYIVKKIMAEDEAGNIRYYFDASDELVANQKITVAPNPEADVKSPELTALSFDKETAKPGEDVKVSAIISDDISGVEHVTVFFISPNLLDKRRVQLKAPPRPPIIIKPGLDVQNNLFEGTLKIHELDETGDWSVTRLVATDFANNYLNVMAEHSEDLASLRMHFSRTGQKASQSTSDAGMAAPERTAGKIRRVDMIPPHPPRGACLNCHEP